MTQSRAAQAPASSRPARGQESADAMVAVVEGAMVDIVEGRAISSVCLTQLYIVRAMPTIATSWASNIKCKPIHLGKCEGLGAFTL